MTVDPLDCKGYIGLKDLNKASERASKNLFFNRKYNQVSYLVMSYKLDLYSTQTLKKILETIST